MERIQNNLLSDTLNLVQLARETARIRGSQQQAEKLAPVVSQLKTLVTQQNETQSTQPTGILAQDDFQSLLSIEKKSGRIQFLIPGNATRLSWRWLQVGWPTWILPARWECLGMKFAWW